MVEEHLALLIVKQFVVEAIYRFPEDLPQNAVVVHNGFGHEVHPFVVRASGCYQHRRGRFFIDAVIVYQRLVFIYILS